jgi:RNA polymerase sigma factor (TIGR02999 family)
VPDAPQTGVTQLLREAGRGDRQADGSLFERVYDELRSIARSYLRDERPDHTLQATALVHEAYLRLVGAEQIEWQSRAQFFSIAAQVMRHILVDHARRHAAEKRGGGDRKLALDEAVSFAEERDINLVALDDALKTLEALDAEQARIVELRFFGGLSIREAAAALDVSETTVSRKWNTAKLWLRARLAAR